MQNGSKKSAVEILKDKRVSNYETVSNRIQGLDQLFNTIYVLKTF